MEKLTQSVIGRYGIAFALWAAATIISLLLPQPYSPVCGTPLLIAAVAISSLIGRLGPGLFVTALSALAIDYFFITPKYSFGFVALADAIRLVIFVLLAVLISSLNTLRLNAERRVNANEIELCIAQEIQQRLLPSENPEVPGFDISGKSIPALATGGDYFDFIPLADGSLGIVMADVTGHGFGPALLMAETRAFLRTLALTHCNVGQILAQLNRLVFESTDDERFITLFLARLDGNQRTFSFVSAGHESYLIEATGEFRRLASSQLPLGIQPHIAESAAGVILLEPDQIILLVTDGVFEAMSPGGELFSLNRIVRSVDANRQQSAEAIIGRLFAQVNEFSHYLPQHDDMTAVVVKVVA